MTDERCEAKVRIFQNNTLLEDLGSRMAGLVPVSCDILCNPCGLYMTTQYQAETTFESGARLIRGEALIDLSKKCKPWAAKAGSRGRLMIDQFAPEPLKLDKPK